MRKLRAHSDQPMQTGSSLTFRMVCGSNLGKRWINTHAPNVQGSRNAVRMFSIQPVSEMVQTMSQACRPVQVLRTEKAPVHPGESRPGVWNAGCVRGCVWVGGLCLSARVYRNACACEQAERRKVIFFCTA